MTIVYWEVQMCPLENFSTKVVLCVDDDDDDDDNIQFRKWQTIVQMITIIHYELPHEHFISECSAPNPL